MFHASHRAERVRDALLLAVAANEEAERWGHSQVDTDHLLLGLIALGGPATQVLERHGVLLGRARSAVTEIQRHDLTAVGIESPDTTLTPPTRYTVGLRPMTVAASAAVHADLGDGLALLRCLLADPESQSARLVAHLGAEIPAADLSGAGVSGPTTSRAGWQSTYSVVIAAPRDMVWALLDEPTRRAVWDTDVHDVRVIDEEHFVGRPPHADDGSGIVGMLVAGVDLDVHHHLAVREPGRVIEWRIVFPARAHTEHLRVELEDADGGTRMTLLHRDERTAGLANRLLRWASRGQLRLRLRAQAITQAVS